MSNSHRRAWLFPIIFVLSILLTFSDFGIIADSGNNIDAELVWNYDQNTKTLKVSALSAYNNMPDYKSRTYASSESDLPPWAAVENDIETVIIENGVLKIGNYAFCDCQAVKTVIIGDTVNIIGKGAFSGCNSLESVNPSKNLKAIEDFAFSNCVSLNGFDFPKGVSNIGASAFYNCVSLKALNIPQSLTDVMPLAFAGCSGLEKISVESYNSAFLSCGNCLIDKNEKTLIAGCKNSVIPSDGSVTSISPYAFYNCEGLVSINIPNIGNDTFSIGDNAFFGCSRLIDVRFYGNRTEWKTMLNFNTGTGNEPLIGANCRFFGFKDVMNNTWYANAVQYVSCNNIILGYNDGHFGATDYLKRQDAVVILSRMSKSDLTAFGNTSPFSDVSKNQYYTSAIVWGKRNGIVNGYTNRKFGVGDRVTREQFLCFLYRYAKYTGIDTSTKIDRKHFAEKYTDFYSISPYAVDAVCWALEKGVISGRTADTISPGGYSSRAEISQMFFNIYKNSVLEG